MSCVSTALCLAVGSDGTTRRFTGSTWVVADTPPVGGTLSCARSTYCVDFGTSEYAIYDGKSWSEPIGLPTAPFSGPTSCARATFCTVANGNRLAQFNWHHWSLATTVPDDPAPLNRVSCASSRFCVGIDTYWAHTFNRTRQLTRTRIGLRMEPPS